MSAAAQHAVPDSLTANNAMGPSDGVLFSGCSNAIPGALAIRRARSDGFPTAGASRHGLARAGVERRCSTEHQRPYYNSARSRAAFFRDVNTSGGATRDEARQSDLEGRLPEHRLDPAESQQIAKER